MKRVIDCPQQSDMGSGFGHIDGCKGVTLSEVLDWIEKNNKTWGTISIYFREKPIRIFDYDVYNGHEFYHHMSGWDYKMLVNEVKFNYCFMSEDIDIYLNNEV